MTVDTRLSNEPFDEAEVLLADLEGVEAVYEGRRLAAQKAAKGKVPEKPTAQDDKHT